MRGSGGSGLTTQNRRRVLLAAVERELERRAWLEQERHVETVTFVIRLDRDGNEARCVVKTEGAS